ncbi:MAG: hypothetical protein HETSPECPRED_002355 [Heterodermia speciosa]|uniref:Major facilitator superfamily (MFS) profile domain-containing protein n=1 Tax=Heterodermia speciosa TaxID=116794 RepID=A0A8H3EZ55_9LECA|nr:MAG: hypothetical protein HETSPECPRED_002355 [Heterodermia speciosa]
MSTEPDHGTVDEGKTLDGSDPEMSNYLKGWSLYVMIIALSLAAFLATLEVSIVATSLVAISDEMQGLSRSSWIITAYMLTYTGFLIIWAKFSDIFGRKPLVVASISLFIVFSAACGGAQTLTQLIIFRALQGIGGAGTYSLVFVIFFEAVSPEKFAPYSSLLSANFALALLLGPLLGGLINNYTTIPAGLVSIGLLLFSIPKNFPFHGLPSSAHKPLAFKQLFSKAQFSRVDFPGTALLLSATVFLVAALEEAGSRYEWKSPFIVAVLAISLVSWALFLAWSRRTTRTEGAQEPVFPWRLVQNRVRIGLLGNMFLTGAPFTVAVIQIPLRFQAVNGLSPLQSGIRLLPFAILSPIGSGIAAGVTGKMKIPPVHVMLVGSAVQIVGFTLLSFSSTTSNISNAQYGYEAIAGFAVGINIACLIVMTPFLVEERDKSVAMSAVIQFRTMGGAIGLAIVTNVFNSYLKSHLAAFLSPTQLSDVLQTTQAFASLPSDVAELTKIVFARGYNLQMRVMIGFCAAQIPITLTMWQKKQVLV